MGSSTSFLSCPVTLELNYTKQLLHTSQWWDLALNWAALISLLANATFECSHLSFHFYVLRKLFSASLSQTIFDIVPEKEPASSFFNACDVFIAFKLVLQLQEMATAFIVCLTLQVKDTTIKWPYTFQGKAHSQLWDLSCSNHQTWRQPEGWQLPHGASCQHGKTPANCLGHGHLCKWQLSFSSSVCSWYTNPCLIQFLRFILVCLRGQQTS